MKKQILSIKELIALLPLKFEGFLYSDSKTLGIHQNILLVSDDPYLDLEIIDNYSYLMGAFQFEDIINNLKQQIENPTMNTITKAINFYIENNAFIILSAKSRKI